VKKIAKRHRYWMEHEERRFLWKASKLSFLIFGARQSLYKERYHEICHTRCRFRMFFHSESMKWHSMLEM